MRRLSVGAGLGLLLAAGAAPAQQPVAMKVKAPEVQGIAEWINSKPLEVADLKGRVVVLHFWAFG